MSDRNERNLPLFFLGLAGLLVSVSAGALEHLPVLSHLCAAACRETAEISLLNVPIWAWGAAFWAAVTVLALTRSRVIPTIAGPAAGMEAAFVWIMLQMGAACVFCIANMVVVALLLALSLRREFLWRQAAMALLFLIAGATWIPYENSLNAAPIETAHGGEEIAARVGDEKITDKRIEVLLGSRLLELKREIYRMKKERLDQLIIETVLQKESAQSGQPMDKFLDQAVPPALYRVAEQDIDQYIKDNQDRVAGFQGPTESLRARVRAFLEQQKRIQAMNAYAQSLYPKYGVEVYLPVPQPPSVNMDIKDAPSVGPPNAAVTVIEFSDYQCPACRSTHEVVKKVREAYGDKVRWIFMDYPLKRHKDSFKAAEAAQCAADYGKFWEYQDILFTRSRFDVESFVNYAGELGVPAEAFRRCLQDEKHKARIERFLRDANKAGIDRTPSFLINGVLHTGGLPFENFAAVIDDELERAEPQK